MRYCSWKRISTIDTSIPKNFQCFTTLTNRFTLCMHYFLFPCIRSFSFWSLCHHSKNLDEYLNFTSFVIAVIFVLGRIFQWFQFPCVPWDSLTMSKSSPTLFWQEGADIFDLNYGHFCWTRNGSIWPDRVQLVSKGLIFFLGNMFMVDIYFCSKKWMLLLKKKKWDSFAQKTWAIFLSKCAHIVLLKM